MKPSESQVSVLESASQTASKPNRLRSSWHWLLLVPLLVGGIIGLWRVFTPGSQPPSPAVAQVPPPRPVETVALTQGDGVRPILMLGQVEASESATLRTQTAGLVQKVLVQPGDRVSGGMSIAILDDADQRLAVAQAQAQLAQERSELARLEVGTRREIIAQRQAELGSAQAREQEAQDNMERTSELVETGALSRRTLVEARANADSAREERLQAEAALAEATAGPTREEIDAQRASLAAAQSALNQAQLTLQRTRIRALSGGIVQTREVSAGDLVQSGDAIATLVNGTQLDVFLELPEELSGRVAPGLPVELTARSLPNWRGRATLTGVVPSADATSRRQRVRVRLQNPPDGLVPGMAMQGELQIPTNAPSFIVPRDALTRREDKWLLFSIADGKAQQLEVELIADMGDKMAIANQQLRVGQSVVVRGGDALTNGAAVQATEREAASQTSNN